MSAAPSIDDDPSDTGLVALCLAADVRAARTDADLADLSRRLAPFHAEPVVQSLNASSSSTVIAALGIRNTYCSQRTPSGNSTCAMLNRSRRVPSTSRSP